MDKLTDQVAVVTGGASGLGRAIGEVLAEAGLAGLTIADINDTVGTAEDLDQRLPTEVLGVVCDVADKAQVDAMMAQTLARFGRIDVLVNNAGIAPAIDWSGVNEENWRQVLDINLNGAFLCCMAALPTMREQKAGRIVNISSVGAFVGSVSAHPAYGVSKAGLIAMTKSLAKSCAADGILVNAIAPGSFATPLAAAFGEEQVQAYVDAALLKRQGDPRELADAVLYLVSSRSTYVTGSTLHINGGSLLI